MEARRVAVFRYVITAALLVTFAACDATGGGSSRPEALESDEQAVVLFESPTPTDAATPRPTPQPTATPAPVPPKPTGVTFEWYNESDGPVPAEGDTAAIGDFILTVTWKEPRSKGTQVRIFGVTECFEMAGDDYCLRKRTPLPADTRVLVAKAPASEGTVTFRLPLGGYGWESKNGRPIYSFVIAAYNESGHSIFEIVEPGTACSVRQCDTY